MLGRARGRTHPEIPVLVLSAEADVGARVEMLEAGAVDFLAKPFAVRELLARVKSRLRRAEEVRANGTNGEEVLRVGSVWLDVPTRTIRIDDGPRAVAPGVPPPPAPDASRRHGVHP